MEFDKLNYVEVIADCKSLSKAAKVLHISQPALTRYVNRLEEGLGIRLFDRTTIPIRLTAAGEWYIQCARQILEIGEGMSRGIQEIARGERGRLRIGMSPSRMDHWAPHILPPFHNAYPKVEIQLITGGHSELEQAVKNGDIDLAFLPLPVHPLLLDYQIVAEEKILLAVSWEHPVLRGREPAGGSLASPVRLDPKLLNGETFLVVPRDHSMYKITVEVLERNRVKPGRLVEYPDSNLTYKLACENMGLTFIQDTTVLYPGYYKTPCFCTVDDIPVTCYIAAVYKSKKILSPLAERFLWLAEETIRSSPYLCYDFST